MPKYMDVGRILSVNDIIGDNGRCGFYVNEDPNIYVIASSSRHGHVLYPDNEMSRYRPIDQAVFFGSIDNAKEHLNKVKDRAWWFDIFKGINDEGEPDIESWGKPWGNDMEVMRIGDFALHRIGFNNYRIEKKLSENDTKASE